MTIEIHNLRKFQLLPITVLETDGWTSGGLVGSVGYLYGTLGNDQQILPC